MPKRPRKINMEVRDKRKRAEGTGFNKLAQQQARSVATAEGPSEFSRPKNRIEPGIDNMPLMGLAWIPRDELFANDYNPNRVSRPELELLKTSILEDGWTQPIVARPPGSETTDDGRPMRRIVDGFHRWTVSEDPDVFALTDGYVPVVTLRETALEHQMMSTIRHNRARGNHLVVRMADIVYSLIEEEGLTPEEVGIRLGMEQEEVLRLYDRTTMADYGRGISGYSRAWEPE